MKTLELWVRPGIMVFLWVVMTAFALLELATVEPMLRSMGGEPPQFRELQQRPLETRAQASSRPAMAR